MTSFNVINKQKHINNSDILVKNSLTTIEKTVKDKRSVKGWQKVNHLWQLNLLKPETNEHAKRLRIHD